MIKWKSDYSVNQPNIDQEHQSLFRMLNQFYQGIKDGSSKERLAQLIKGLLEYAQNHFSHEERFMQSIGYPRLQTHRKEHHAFIQKVNEFYDKYSSGRLILSLEVTGFIKDWITNHILNEDKKYADFVLSQKKE
ncbi:bacteriohemerythrin [Thermophagus sp. OGC60D27]|uniref:bacteriohemerythrin n=1 Tax=Thermophagus sp. OGC60D27 TaxID=3458415 RepID=UPI0040383325